MAKAKQPKRPTSLDVARLAGVSHTTVSFVINGVTTAGISEETRARVFEAIAKLDYQPHESARSLRSRSSRIIGMVIPEVANEHHQMTASGVEQYLRKHGYTMFLSVTNFIADEERRCLQLLKKQRFDGLILSLGTGLSLHKEVAQLTEQGYVITGLGFDEEHIDFIRTESAVGERQLLEHLVSLGHQRIGYIYGVASYEEFNNRLDTCLTIQQELGIPVVEKWVYRCGPSRDDGYHAAQALLQACPVNDRPTALVVVNDMLASAVEVALHEAHIRIPEEMSVASFDNTPLATYTYPPLTSVDCEAAVMGEQAARMTLERLAVPQRPIERIYTHAKLVVRGSTGPAPSMEENTLVEYNL